MNKILLSILYYSFYILFPIFISLLWFINKKKGISIETAVLLLICLILIWARFVEPNLVIIKKYEHQNNNKPSKSINVAILSDIHIGVFNNNNVLKKAIDKINNSDTDLLVMPGDFVYLANIKNLEKNLSVLKNVNIPVVAVLGNHDYERNALSAHVIRALESAGVTMIDNKEYQLSVKDSSINIIGLADVLTARPDYSILENKEDANQHDVNIILTHNPDIVHKINLAEGDIRKIDLMISGHTHAGQIRIPFIYKHLIPTKYGFDKGFYKSNNIDIFVTPGVGNVLLPMRLFNFPEVSIIKINY